MNRTGKIISLYQKYVLNTYSRVPVAFVRGKGSWIWDAEGRRYLDFFPGVGVGGLGHCHPAVVAAVRAQAGKLIHIANTYYSPQQAELARVLQKLARFPGRVFFCNSGAEANEALIKLARRWGQVVVGDPRRTEIVAVRDAFHGRTLGALAATGRGIYQKGFAPLPRGFRHVPLNDEKAARRAIGRRTCGVLIEPILGEGGIKEPERKYLRLLRALTKKHRALLLFDEVQSGGGRTGVFFAHQAMGVVPDAVGFAKTIAGGLPMGAMIVRQPFAGALPPGTHASTFGGSPLVCAAALAAIKMTSSPALLSNVRRLGAMIRKELEGFRRKYPALIRQVRGRGLMIGMELSVPGAGVVRSCLDERLLINCTHETVVRMLPPLTVSASEVLLALSILGRALEKAAKELAMRRVK